MRIPAREVLFTGQDRCPEFELCKAPLPEELNILLCLLEGAERRQQIQAKLNVGSLDLSPEEHAPSSQGADQGD